MCNKVSMCLGEFQPWIFLVCLTSVSLVYTTTVSFLVVQVGKEAASHKINLNEEWLSINVQWFTLLNGSVIFAL